MATKAGNPRTTTLEQFYTPQDWADKVAAAVVGALGINPPDSVFIEPAGGSGAFVRSIQALGGSNIMAVDVDPRDPGVSKVDFLKTKMNLEGAICITNPPFGRNHSLSVPFFNKLAAEGCDVIAFIVPRSWRKWSIINRLDDRFFKVIDTRLPITSYVDDSGNNLSETGILQTVLQVWVKGSSYGISGRRSHYPSPVTKKHFEVVSPPEATAALTIFGRGCGTIRTEFEQNKKTTQMYLKISDKELGLLRQADLAPFYTQVAYVEALSRVEIDYAIDAAARGKSLGPDFLRDCSTDPLLGRPQIDWS